MRPLWKSKRRLYRQLKACYRSSQSVLWSRGQPQRPSLSASLYEFSELMREGCCGVLCLWRSRLCVMLPLLAACLLLLVLLQEDPSSYLSHDAKLGYKRGLLAGLLPWNEQESSIDMYTPFPLLAVNCPAILEGDMNQIDFTKDMLYKEYQHGATDTRMIEVFSNCSRLHSFMQVLSRDPSAGYPTAYIIELQQNAYQLQLLMQVIFSPHNAFCLILNTSSSPLYKRAVITFSKCFDNIIVHNISSSRQYRDYALLDAEITCMHKLISLRQWNYLMNLPGDAFPIHSSSSIIKQLSSLNGKNVIPGEVLNSSQIWNKHLAVQDLTLYQGSQYYIVSWDFVKYIASHRLPRQIWQYINSTHLTDKPRNIYWPTLNFMQHTPGGRAVHDIALLPFVKTPNKKDYQCTTEDCIILIDDLVNIKTRNNLFTLGLDSKTDHIAIQCLTEYIKNESYQS